MRTYVDITELVYNPIRSGIQRIVREFISRARREEGYVCCFFHPTLLNLIPIDDEVVDILSERDPIHKNASVDEIRNLVAERIRGWSGDFVDIEGIRIFIPEVFYEINRVRHYRWRFAQNRNIYMLFFDFIPWLFPERIGVKQAASLMAYLQLSTEVVHAAFISEHSQRQWRTRIVRDEARKSTVVRLGSDGLGLEKQLFDPRKKTVVCLGSLDGRKNQEVIARAFVRAWEDGCDLRLVVIGYAFDKMSEAYRVVTDIASKYPQLEYIDGASDHRVLSELRAARATIYGSTIEGFGLPPIEGLFSGIPAIVAEGLPSIAGLPAVGQIRLRDVDETSIAQALKQIADDHFAARLWDECRTLELPTWADFVNDTRAWIEA